MNRLLAVDLGIRTGLALYGADGRLLWYRSKNFGDRSRLRRAARGLLQDIPDLEWLVLEGDRGLALIWAHEANRTGTRVLRVFAERWRERLLPRRAREGSRRAKQYAGEMARRVIEWSGARRPTSLRHDAAEAILVGLWALLELGWITAPRNPARGWGPIPPSQLIEKIVSEAGSRISRCKPGGCNLASHGKRLQGHH